MSEVTESQRDLLAALKLIRHRLNHCRCDQRLVGTGDCEYCIADKALKKAGLS
jgi:hypothetical protein